MDTESSTAFSPPYNIAWATFLSTLERMAADPPNRVDRSYLGSQAGTVQTYLIASYRSFGFIDEAARPTQALLAFGNEDGRKGMIADLLRANYPSIVPLGETNSTPGELAEEFAKAWPSVTGESRVKAIRFFLAAAAYADVKLSPLWKPPKAPRGSSAPRRSRKGSGSAGTNGSAPQRDPKTSPARAVTVQEMRAAYFDLLIKNAAEGGNLDEKILTRIEKLVGVVENDDPGADSQGDEEVSK
jgi:hypothetical protein